MLRVALLFTLAPLVASAQPAFQTPSGNISCHQAGGILRCDITNRSFTPPRPREACELEYGHAITLEPSGPARMLCSGDTIADSTLPVLRYGAAWQGQGLSCTSAETGVRCTNAAGRGFSLSRARLELF